MGRCIFASLFQFSRDFLDALLVPHSMSPALQGAREAVLACAGCGAPVGAEGSLCLGTAGSDAQRLPCSVLQQA